jgi:hypothetical protein
MMLRIKSSFALVSIAALILLVSSCAGAAAPDASIADLTLSTGFISDYRPLDNISEFYVDSPQVCCSAGVTGVSANTVVTANWVYIKGEMSKETDPLILHDQATCDTDCYVGFTLPAPAGGFIGGDYRVDLFINGQPGGSAGFSIKRDPSVPLPKIASFTASPSRIVAGQSVQLGWKVSDASRIYIRPVPGVVNAEGGVSVTPAEDTTYTLYAMNRGGVSSSRLNVNVSPEVKEKPDLQVTELWTSGNVLTYRVKNTGNLASCPTMSRLYKNGTEVSQDYMAPLAAGEERAEAFQQYHFSPRFNYISGQGGQSTGMDAVNIRICVNSDESCAESDLSNNCLEHDFGL